MTRTVIRTMARKKLGESTAVFFQDSDLNQWIENAQLDIVWKTRCKRQRSLATTIADTVRYTLSTLVSNLFKIIRVRIYDNGDSKWRRIDQHNQDYLDMHYPQWESADAGDPILYVYDLELNEFILYPKADTDHVGTNYLEIYNTPKPTAIATDSTSPDLPEVLHPAVIDFVVATGSEARGYQDIANTHWGFYYQKMSSYMSERDNQEDEEIVMRPDNWSN